MAKYVMLNCWDDFNKGDLGIMLAMVQELKRKDQNSEIVGVSCFNGKDPSFLDGHTILRQFVPRIYPALFGTIGLYFRGTYRKSIFCKLIALFLENIKYYFCIYTPKRISKIFLNKQERQTLEILLQCDVAFSKGGSVFTDYNSKRGALALIRLCRMYNLLYKYKIKYFILGQSFGPVCTKRGIKEIQKVIDHAEHVFLRENECVRKYKKLQLQSDCIRFSNDAGFLIDPKPVEPNPIHHHCLNVGITVRGEAHDSRYLESMAQMIAYLVKSKQAMVHIFQQVSMDTEPDNQAAETIIKTLDADTAGHVVYHKENYMPQELCWLYGEMDFFIGTRLHSAVFSMRAGTPALGIVYHGTKTQGIFENIGVSELVISGGVTFEKLKEKFEYMVANKESITKVMNEGVNRARKEMQAAVFFMVNEAKGNCQDDVL